jgi:hypothetical protein
LPGEAAAFLEGSSGGGCRGGGRCGTWRRQVSREAPAAVSGEVAAAARGGGGNRGRLGGITGVAGEGLLFFSFWQNVFSGSRLL